MQSKENVDNSTHDNITLSSTDILNRYIKQHHSSSAHTPKTEDHLLVHTSAEKS